MLVLIKTKCNLMMREYISLFFSIIFCPMLLIIFGAINGNEPVDIYGGLGTVDISLPSYAGLIFAGTGLISLPVSVASMRERGELRRFQMTPISPIIYLFTDVLVYFFISIIGMCILMLLGYFVYDSKFIGNPLILILGLILCGVCIFPIGMTIASLSKTSKMAQTIGMVVGFPMMFLSGASMPLELMPDTMEKIAKFLPLYYCVSLMRKIWVGESFSVLDIDILIMLAIAIVFTVITAITFRWN